MEPIESDDVATDRRVARELTVVGTRRQLRIAGVRISGRRRRPSGEVPPIPRDLFASGRLMLVSLSIVVLVWTFLFLAPGMVEFWDRNDQAALDLVVERRSPSATRIAKWIHAIGSEWFVRVLRIACVVSLAAVRRWRHLFGFLLAVLVVEFAVAVLVELVGRPRPFVEILGPWSGSSHPSGPVASLGVTLVAMAFTLLPRGRARRGLLMTAVVAMTALGAARVYLGIDHPTDAIVSALFAPAVGVVLLRWFAPETAFPVTWSRGVKAHLDVAGARGEAIHSAVAEQLGLDVVAVEPFGQEGSGGSTPLRLKVATDPDRYVFAKLYSQTHLRSDRWYKVARTILYGALEDELRFTSVRRLVEYEDYVQRLMRDSGVPSAEPIGVVELTPEREYLMVSEFLDGAIELTEAEVDDAVIDDALSVIRTMWDAGLAHRDIKPANVMVRDGQVVLIDVAFGTVRPTPWRQAVDLANMMVILGLRTSAQRVYQRALLQFAPEDIGEAFAATRSVTLPSQSRSSLQLLKKEQGVDLVAEFRRLAPKTEPISIQRWSPRRVRLAAGALLGVVLLFGALASELLGQGVL